MKYYAFQNDALEQISMVEREMQDSLKELEAINPLYESQVDKEKQTTKRQVYIMSMPSGNCLCPYLKWVGCMLTEFKLGKAQV